MTKETDDEHNGPTLQYNTIQYTTTINVWIMTVITEDLVLDTKHR